MDKMALRAALRMPLVYRAWGMLERKYQAAKRRDHLSQNSLVKNY
jgi:hypothetical protein